MIKEHLQLVFTKVTPDLTKPSNLIKPSNLSQDKKCNLGTYCSLYDSLNPVTASCCGVRGQREFLVVGDDFEFIGH